MTYLGYPSQGSPDEGLAGDWDNHMVSPEIAGIAQIMPICLWESADDDDDDDDDDDEKHPTI